ncbi:putative RNA-directed DNA polymerase [Tanacetum coccineum]
MALIFMEIGLRIPQQSKITSFTLSRTDSRKVVASVVGDVQMTYIKGRQIIDGPLMVEEIIAWAKKAKKRLMILKVDFEKAFDSLNWSFLFSILEQMGFSAKWRNWIHSCLNSAYASILVNGSPTKEFKIERGLRQGDPLSPFLFILAVEALNVVLLEATNNNVFHGFHIGKEKVHISHLQFADDALIMGEWSYSNAKNLSRILTCFHLASGLKVNFNKSKLYGVGVTNDELSSLASTIGCLALHSIPCVTRAFYWDCQKCSWCHHWNKIVERFQKCLSKWKSKSLSFGGRLTLIKSVLGSLGVYYFSTFKEPKTIISTLETIRRKFFWGGCSEDNKISWIAWDKVIKPCDRGGLGISSLWTCNQTMLAKWWWRIQTENQALGCKVIRSIHGPTGGLHNNTSLKSNSGPWYHIMKLKDDLLGLEINLPSLFKRKLENGQKISFWHDIDNTPNMFSIRIHHGGKFQRYPDQVYFSGHQDIFDMVDNDLFTVVALNMMVVKLGYTCESETLFYNYLRPITSVDEMLYALACVEDARCLATFVRSFKLIEVIDDVMRHLSFEETKLDGEAGFADVAGSDVGRTQEPIMEEVITQEPIMVDVSTQVPIMEEEDESTPSDEQFLYGDEGIDIAYETEYDVQSSEDAGTDDDDDDEEEDFLVDEENEIVEPDVDVHLFGISTDLPFDNIGVTNLVPDDVLEGEDVDVINVDGFDSGPGNDNETNDYKRRRLAELSIQMKGVINDSGQWKKNLKLYKNDNVRIRARCDGKVPVFTSHKCLGDDIDLLPNSNFTFISDRQKIFNGKIVGGSGKPVITLLEYTREYCMKRIINVQSVIEKCTGPLTPTINKIMESIKKEAHLKKVQWNRANKYQVSSSLGDQYVVDVVTMTCSCRKWELTGIPYKHIVAPCWNMALKDRAALPLEASDFLNIDGNNAETNGSASRQAQQTKHAVGQDGSGRSGAGAVIGLSAAAGQGDAGGPSGASIGSKGSSHTRWIKRRVQTERISPQKRTHTQPASQPSTSSQVPVSEIRNADGREIGDGESDNGKFPMVDEEDLTFKKLAPMAEEIIMLSEVSDIVWYTDEIREQLEKVADGWRDTFSYFVKMAVKKYADDE